MGATAYLLLLFTHPQEFRTLVQFKLWHEYKRDITAVKEHADSGWDRETMRRCWEFLDLTSRSFAAVIKELEGDLARTICLFYLVLRGLDTIEDDMTIPDDKKQPLLRNFHNYTVTPGWTFTGSGPNEKDRQLLIEYDKVVHEVNLLRPEYKEVIIDIAQKMAVGMADFAHKASQSSTGAIYLPTIADYDLYCHYVAGLVGEGLSRIFSASNKEAPWLGEQLELSNSMGLLLQKTNIIRDYREDIEERRYFWPQEIWGRKELDFVDMADMCAPHNVEKALWAQSGMVLDAMRHLTDALDYLKLLKNQSVFNFCAIPATMAIATLELCFMNPEMFQRNIKIRKAQAADLIMRSTNPREVSLIFKSHCRRIHQKAVASDPSFIRISVACAKVEQWCEYNYPSFIHLSSNTGTLKQALNPFDARTKVVLESEEFDRQLEKKRRLEEIRSGLSTRDPKTLQPVQAADDGVREVMTYVAIGSLLILAFSGLVIWFILQYFA